MKLGHMQPAHVAVRNLRNKRQRSDNGRHSLPGFLLPPIRWNRKDYVDVDW